MICGGHFDRSRVLHWKGVWCVGYGVYRCCKILVQSCSKHRNARYIHHGLRLVLPALMMIIIADLTKSIPSPSQRGSILLPVRDQEFRPSGSREHPSDLESCKAVCLCSTDVRECRGYDGREGRDGAKDKCEGEGVGECGDCGKEVEWKDHPLLLMTVD
jgi:hypothetical protein